MTDSELAKFSEEIRHKVINYLLKTTEPGATKYVHEVDEIILDAFKTVRTQEREACAGIVEEHICHDDSFEIVYGYNVAVKEIAKTLRDSKP